MIKIEYKDAYAIEKHIKSKVIPESIEIIEIEKDLFVEIGKMNELGNYRFLSLVGYNKTWTMEQLENYLKHYRIELVSDREKKLPMLYSYIIVQDERFNNGKELIICIHENKGEKKYTVKEQIEFFESQNENDKKNLDIFETIIDLEYQHPKGKTISERFFNLEDTSKDFEHDLTYFLMKEDIHLLKNVDNGIDKEEYIDFYYHFYENDYDEIDISEFYSNKTPLCLEIGSEAIADKELEEMQKNADKIYLSPEEEQNIDKLYDYFLKLKEQYTVHFFFNGSTFTCEYDMGSKDKEELDEIDKSFHLFMKYFKKNDGIVYFTYKSPIEEGKKIINGFEMYNGKLKAMSVKTLKNYMETELEEYFDESYIPAKAFLKF